MSKVKLNKKEDLDEIASYDEFDRTVFGDDSGKKKSGSNSRPIPRK